ncbi:VanZ family protein [Microbacterium sp. NPDC056052]|uniref:VanZ family protein n=1 Tax=Microbacterium sp. NPDC056052 TaxID=3345695 RepID=UPI0035D98AF0
MTDEASGTVPAQRMLRRTWPLLLAYGVALALIAFWPQHVDKGMGFFLKTITRYLPALTYNRIEFASNILLFVPLGILLAILLSRRRYLIMPIGVVVSLTIESAQGVFLSGRTSSISDLIANTAGTCVGLLVVEFVDAVGRGARDR